MSDERPAEATEQQSVATATTTAAPRRRRTSLLVNLAAVGGLLILLGYLHTRVVQVMYVGTGSMEPTIQPGDRLLVHLSAYRKAAPKRGDIVAFWSEDQGEYEVKRVIGAGGDRIVVGGGIVILNGNRLDEPYIAQQMLREIPVGRALAEDELWVMGDNRNESEDSRDSGPIRRDQVMGRLFFRVLPLSHAGRLK